jgi:hypothetical protein
MLVLPVELPPVAVAVVQALRQPGRPGLEAEEEDRERDTLQVPG